MSTEQSKFANQSKAEGSFKRSATKFHDKISTENSAKYPPVSGRYRLYVSYACPWAHRCLLVRKLKGLENAISLTVTDYELPNLSFSHSDDYKGWTFVKNSKKRKDQFFEPHGFTHIADLYEHAYPGYRKEYNQMNKRPVYSVPVLFDEKTQTIVSNESSEIIVMFNSAFNKFADNPDLDLNPEELKVQMEKVNSIVYPSINDGVYRCGFAKSQAAYEDAYNAHWEGMDAVEDILSKHKFLTGDKLTLSDIRLFVTLIRYDLVYYAHFKTSRNLVKQMPNMLRFLKSIYNMAGVKETINVEHIVKHYYGSQKMVNPTGIWPLGALEPTVLDYLSE